MSFIFKKISITQTWLILFGLWFLFLTGSLSRFVDSPGILQALKLNALLSRKQNELSQLQADVRRLQTEIELLENNRSVQIREIRRVLGYTSDNEIIFDFTHIE